MGISHSCPAQATNATEALNNLKFANMARVETMKAMGAAHNLQEAPHDFEFPDGRKITWEAFVEGRFLVEEEEAEDYLAAMIDAGTLKYEEDVVVGDLDVIPDAFCRLFHGSNHGKMLVTVWNSTTGLGGPDQTSEFSSSIKSKSIRLTFGRIDCSRRVLEAQPKSLRRNCRICSH